MTVFMTRAPISISDEALIQFAVGAVLILTAIAFVAYVWTWLAARPRRSEAPASAPPPAAVDGREVPVTNAPGIHNGAPHRRPSRPPRRLRGGGGARLSTKAGTEIGFDNFEADELGE